MSTPFVVIPRFRVAAAAMPEFLDAAGDDARHSMAEEPGCRQFDVVVPENAQGIVTFYEVYDSRAAFDAHLATPHLKRFQAAMQRLGVEEIEVLLAARMAP